MESTECGCFMCDEPLLELTEEGLKIINNVHGKLQSCDTCGRSKTEPVDLGDRIIYECWWCTDRATNDAVAPQVR